MHILQAFRPRHFPAKRSGSCLSARSHSVKNVADTKLERTSLSADVFQGPTNRNSSAWQESALGGTLVDYENFSIKYLFCQEFYDMFKCHAMGSLNQNGISIMQYIGKV